jgi:hypothetical protein
MNEIEQNKVNFNREVAQKHYQDGIAISDEISRNMLDMQGQITRCFIFLFQGSISKAKEIVKANKHEFDSSN